MPPKPIGDRPLTAIERVQRYRAKQTAELEALKVENDRLRADLAAAGMPDDEPIAAIEIDGPGTALQPPETTEDGWQQDENGVWFTLPQDHDPAGAYYLIHPSGERDGVYLIFFAIGRAIQPLGSTGTIEDAKAMARRHGVGPRVYRPISR
jgi:hypothetical protein